ncbi:MAG: hypothetical protein K9J13_05515 [Saprospiraceae bacterium]|nr:hypothetical protein [Saprospiraceae bacterium]
MENTTIFQAYLITFVVCTSLTVGLLILINKGLKKFFNDLSHDSEISKFFVKLTNIIILLGGMGAALTSGYNSGEDTNWLTLSWDVAEQLEDSLGRLLIIMMIFAITFFILHLVTRRTNK